MGAVLVNRQAICFQCASPIGPIYEGDVEMCTVCGQWHVAEVATVEDIDTGTERPAVFAWPCIAAHAAELARAPMSLEEISAAFAWAEQRMMY